MRWRWIGVQGPAAVLCGVLVLPSVGHAQAAVARSATGASSTVEVGALPDAPMPDLEDVAREDQPQAAAQAQQQAPAEPQQGGQQSGQQTGEQTTPPSQSNQPSLGDLGFSAQQTQANAQLQARLNQRTHDLKVHQTLGLITLAPLVATVAVSGGATQKHGPNGAGSSLVEPSSAGVDLHVALGSTTVAMYAATAWFAIRAPKIPGTEPKGAIRLHRDLTWIHGPGMILTPILGAMALDQENKNEKIHGIASAHQYVAWTTVVAYTAAAVSISWPLHLKFWEHQ